MFCFVKCVCLLKGNYSSHCFGRFFFPLQSPPCRFGVRIFTVVKTQQMCENMGNVTKYRSPWVRCKLGMESCHHVHSLLIVYVCVCCRERETDKDRKSQRRLAIHPLWLFSFHYRVNRLLLQKTHSWVAMSLQWSNQFTCVCACV